MRTGSTITASGVAITTHGNFDTVNVFGPAGFNNQSSLAFPGGGMLNLTDSSILTTGTQAMGGVDRKRWHDEANRRLDQELRCNLVRSVFEWEVGRTRRILRRVAAPLR